MRKIFYLLISCLLVSCVAREELYTPDNTQKRFHATIEDDATRTFINDQIRLRWTAGDLITLFEGSTRNKKYIFEGETGDNAGDFRDVTETIGTGISIDRYYAIYPYSSTNKLDEDGYISYTYPTVQSYAENSFGLGANPMVAVTQDLNDLDLCFRNTSGYLRIFLYGDDDIIVKSIKIEGNKSEPVAGKAIITPSYGGLPTTEMDETATSTVTLDCCDGVTIGSTAETSTPFWIVLPPTSFTEGFTLTITDAADRVFTKTFNSSIEIERNKYLSARFKVEMPIPYLTFSAKSEQFLSITKEVETLEYSVNGDEWSELGTEPVRFGGDWGDLRLRGMAAKGTAYIPNQSNYIRDNCASFVFREDVEVSCTGDIRTLVNYKNIALADNGECQFCYLFADCVNLISAPELPLKNLAEFCYVWMFSGCTKLTEGPELPATTTVNYCYQRMFSGCTGLTKAPDLIAEVAVANCYKYMFSKCSSLTTPPRILAYSVDYDSCVGMFSSCTSLVYAPELLITDLKGGYCCENMFYECTSLIEAPALPATELAYRCYSQMFYGCTSLREVPALPATKLARGCYSYMFAGCSNLVTSPVLPAKVLEEDCYDRMFSGCSKLNYVTMLATSFNKYTSSTTISSCLDNWLDGVASKGTLVKSSEMTLLKQQESYNDYRNKDIPYKWTVVNYEE